MMSSASSSGGDENNVVGGSGGEEEADEFSASDTFNLIVQACDETYQNETEWIAKDHPEGFCRTSFDNITCWRPTPLNTTVEAKCFSQFMGLKYNDTQNASRFCDVHGNWSRSNYFNCKPIFEHETEVVTTANIYFVGYSLSLVALSVAIVIFLHFKNLRCLRNRIHTHLMLSFMCFHLLWIITLFVELSANLVANPVACIFLILLHYFHMTTFFWMFVEGLYLYILVVKTFTTENFKLRIYVLIGWGAPALFVSIWGITKSFLSSKNEETVTEDELNVQQLYNACPWMEPHSLDWLHQSPIIIALVLNLIFLMAILWVLIMKLRSTNTVEAQQYRKTAIALLVLMPLLGVPFVLTIILPNAETQFKSVFEWVRAFLLSIQGFCVALLYCFLNSEVHNTVRHQIEIWRTSRNLGKARLRSGSKSKDWSPRSRTESIRLYNQPPYHHKESSASEITTTTLITINGGTRSTTNSGNNSTQIRSPFLGLSRNVQTENV